MADVLTKKQRSYCMSQIRGKDTKPEISLRKELTKKRLRGYRLHYKLTGKPDLVYPRQKLVIFVDGCYFHKCPKCFRVPQTNKTFWMKKIKGNVERDRKVNRTLKRDGWNIIRLWEHDVRKNIDRCVAKIKRELQNG